jgi:signal transduction histidine kinase
VKYRAKIFRTWTFRVVTIYSTIFAVSVLTLLGFIYVTTVGFIDSQINETIVAEINGLNDSYRDEGLKGLVDALNDRIAADRTGDTVYLLTDAQNQVVAGNLGGWPSNPQPQGRWIVFQIEQNDGDQVLNIGQARAISFRLSEDYHLLVGRNLRDRENFQSLIAQSLFWSLIITGVLALIGGIVMSRDMRQRIETINRTTQHIMRGDLSQRVPLTGSDDEFDRLSINLNNMLTQIGRLMNAMREVSDNVAHDLRSPLTRLKTKLELTLLSQNEPEQYRQAIEVAVAETDKILSTFNALLSIAQAESGDGRAEMETIDLMTLCADVVELYEPLADSVGLRVVGTLTPTHIRGNRHLLFQAITNLVDNAIKYGAGGSEIEISVGAHGDQARIVVADNGPGIPAHQHEYVVQRFVRLEVSRTTPGNGLGLSLVTAVMMQHRGRLTLEDNKPGLRAILTLPLADMPASPPRALVAAS